jgi:prepilin-type N-terminal cleavage/methylation domain-containing protein/prepilin-type processing-associated H-X9-DG protein
MKRAFTLIELLVVIAIIAILAAILFPVFAQAKEAAKKTAGLAQMKQIGTAAALYAADFDDGLPTWSVFFAARDEPPIGNKFPSDQPELYWDFLLVPYVKNGALVTRDSGGNAIRDYSGIWRAPGAEYAPSLGRSIVINQLLVWDVSVAQSGTDWIADTNVNNGRYIWPNGSRIEEPANTMFVADGGRDGRYEPIYFGNGYSDKWLTNSIPLRSAPWRYGRTGANYVYTDGHAKHEAGNKVYPNPGPNVPFASWPLGVRRQLWCAAARLQEPTSANKALIRAAVPAGTCID